MLQGLQLMNKFENSRCLMEFKRLEGCYNCLSGAILELECHTDFGTALSHINCNFSTNRYKNDDIIHIMVLQKVDLLRFF